MPPSKIVSNILMQLRKVCQHPYLSAEDLENLELPQEKQHQALINGSGKLLFLKLLLPKLKERGHRVLLFSQFKLALDRIEDFVWAEGYKYLRLDGDVQQAVRQKQMDKFNAPDSDYFIFLLTTRAGGVGINLATADTVIIYDPDFNPHQDLQAISRSYRYGQKKRCLVFKLMTENSVEEQIISNGKRKMVLDHLVVQQMGKDSEGGEIDNLLLHGVEELNKPDTEASYRRYTARDVEELIENAEKQAEEEAKRMEEREKALAVGETEKAKAMNFSFAKVWESRKGSLEEIDGEDEEGGENDIENQENAWQRLLDDAERERLEEETRIIAAADSQRKLKRAGRNMDAKHRMDSMTLEGEKKLKGKGKAKGKGKGKIGEADPDGDFVPQAEFEESDSDSNSSAHDVSAVLGDIVGPVSEGPIVIGELAARVHKLTKAEKRLLKNRPAEAASFNSTSLSADVSTMEPMAMVNGMNGTKQMTMVQVAAQNGGPRRSQTSTPSLPGETKEQKDERVRKKKRAEQTKVWSSSMVNSNGNNTSDVTKSNGSLQQTLNGNGQTTPLSEFRPALTSQPSTVSTIEGRVNRPSEILSPTALAERIALGRDILTRLYVTLRNLGPPSLERLWGMLAISEVSIREKRKLYLQLAEYVDDALQSDKMPQYFTRGDIITCVLAIFESGEPVIPPTTPVEKSPRQPVQQQQQQQRLVLHGWPATPANNTVAATAHAFQQPPAFPQGAAQSVRQNSSSHLTVSGVYGVNNYVQQQQFLSHQQHHQEQHNTSYNSTSQSPVMMNAKITRGSYLVNGQGAVMRTFSPVNKAHSQVANTPAAARPQAGAQYARQPSQSQYLGQGHIWTQSPYQSTPDYGMSTDRAWKLGQPIEQQPGTPQNGGSTVDSNLRPLQNTVVSTPAAVAPASNTEAVVPVPAQAVPAPARTPPAPCMWCQDNHELRDCPQLPDLDKLQTYRNMITTSAEPEADKREGLAAIEKMLVARAERERMKRHRLHGARNHPIVIDDNEDDVEGQPLPKRPRSNASIKTTTTAVATVPGTPASANSTTRDGMTQKPKQTQQNICLICGKEPRHSPACCPVIQQGPNQVREVLKRLTPDHELYPVLNRLLAAFDASKGSRSSAQQISASGTAPGPDSSSDTAPRLQVVPSTTISSAPNPVLDSAQMLQVDFCPFCEKICHRTVRECAESHGPRGRKDLKNKIRQLEEKRIEINELKGQLESRKQRLISSGTMDTIQGQAESTRIEKEMEGLERSWEAPKNQLERLFEVYRLWPKESKAQAK